MDREKIISALKTVLDENNSFYKTAFQKATKYPSEIAEVLFYHELSQPVKVVLETQDEFRGSEPQYVFTDTASSRFDLEGISPKLVAKARETGSADLAVDWLEKVISTRQAKGLRIIVLWGLTVQNTVSLTQEVDLIPINQLPESIRKDQLLNYHATKLNHFNLPFEPPQAALVYPMTVEPVISPLQKERSKKDTLHIEHLNEILLALTLVGPCAPARYSSWFQFEDDDLEFAQLSKITSYAIPEIQPHFLKNYGSFDPEVAKQVVALYLRSKDKTKKKVRVALERLRQSIRRSQVGDQAMEVSIALESLLSDGRTEKMYKVGLRAALLLGDKLTDGLNTRSVIESVYGLRSGLVHEGEVSKTVKVKRRGKEKSKDVVDEAIMICARVIRRILELEKIPDWYEFELIRGLAKD